MGVEKTTASFNSMLKTYMPYELLNEEMAKRNYFWQRVKKDSNWKGNA